MIEFRYGRSGTNKTVSLVDEALEHTSRGQQVFYIVPDRQTVNVEKIVFNKSSSGKLDVFDFKRLADYVFRQFGGICDEYIGSSAKKLLMSTTVLQLSNGLVEYGTISKSDIKMTEKLISTRREFTKELITNDMLKQASAQLPGKTGNKLHDLAMIFDEFDNKISQKWKDPDGIMSAVADVLRDKEFFKNSAVFIDGFKSFNKQELQIINIIMEECDEVYISISYNQKEDENSPIFADYISMNKTLHRMANRLSARCVDVNSNVEQKRQKNKELQYMAARYWSGRTGSKQIEETPSHIRLFKTKNKYQEAESVAIDILKQIKSDGSKRRWRDFAVVTRNITSYHGIIDAIFDKYNIPYFDAEKIEIGSLSFVRFIMSALEMVERGVYGDNLISYLKSDMCGIEKDDIYIFENYVSKWRISGRKLFEEFVENPRGMVEYFSESDVELLKRLNDIRNRIVVPLISFFTVFRSAKTVTEKSRALYNFASTLEVSKKLSQSADEAKKNHDYSKELILRQIWKSFCDVLDIMVTSIGDQECDVTQFKTYLQALLSDTKIGSIPLSLDVVTITDAATVSVQGTPCVYMLGCNEGVFPASVDDSGIFTEQEKSELFGVGIELSSRLMNKLTDELYFFYANLASASEELVMTYISTDDKDDTLSSGVRQVKSIFPNIPVIDYSESSDSDKVWDLDSGFEYYVGHDDALSKRLEEPLKENDNYSEKIKSLSSPISAEDTMISAEVANEIFGKEIAMSSSILDTYVGCHFSYFCKYELKLEDNEPHSFDALSIGNFVHKLLEIAVKYVAENPNCSDEDIDKIVAETSENYLKSIIHSDIPLQIKHTTDYLCKSTRKFIDDIKNEMSCSDFKPKDFELRINNGKNDINPLEIVSDDTIFKIVGKVDRVDTYTDENGDTHLLITDYKTGKKTFNMQNVKMGIDMQMLIYLFTLAQNGASKYGNAVPGGISYVTLDAQSTASRSDDDSVIKIGHSSMIFSNEESHVAENMISKSTHIEPVENIDEVKNTVLENIMKLGNDMKSGNANARPIMKNSRDTACVYCQMGPLCRRRGMIENKEDT